MRIGALLGSFWRSVLPAALSAGLAVATGSVAAAQERLDVEALYSAQSRLMAEEVADVRPGVPGKIELFAVLAAWFPTQRVFLSEVEKVADILVERFDAENRVVTLANSAIRPARHPLATPMNLSAAIQAVRDAMNPGEDVMLVYVTSHGGRGVISGGDWAVGTPALFAEQLGRIVDEAKVPNLVAVIGACHAGSFLPALVGPDRLVIAAAAADRSSFGCTDTADWTYFGEAFFDRALRETPSLPDAFDRAAELVAGWEKEEGYRPSQPQMALGDEIAPVLQRLAEDAGRG